MDTPVISQKHSPISPAQSTHLPISNASPDSDQRRLFLDICSGHRAPLSNAILQQHGDVVQFDLLVHAADDLLDDVHFSKLLKLGASGLVAYCGCSPSCCEYSRLKLRPGGPPALRTPEFLQGVPGLDSDDLRKVQESNLMLERCIQILEVVIAAGGHGHLEQPSSAMSWDEPQVQSFIQKHACFCTVVAACGYGKNWYKNWLFASTLASLQEIACTCSHPVGTHMQIGGIRSETGQFLSRDTAEYPADLCLRMASIIVPLLSLRTSNLTLDAALTLIPAKDTDAAPFCRQDGAGFVSQGDWSSPHCSEDVFSSLRKSFFQRIIEQRLDKQVVAAFQTGKDEPPFSSIQLAPFRELLEEFLLAQGTVPDWSVPADQPICLHVLKQLCQCMDDPDTAVFPYLIDGVPIGTDTPILPSNYFPEQPIPDDFDPPLLTVHHTNWMSAEESPDVVMPLIQKEVDEGWVSKFDGTLEEAQSFFVHGLAVGKLGLAISDSRPPRLVLDSTVCGVNPQCVMPEKATLPTIRDVQRSFPLRGKPCGLAGASFDVRSAHKRIAVHPKYRGHLCFQFQSQLFYYRVCPFGAVFSAHFWARLGGIFLRLFHRFCWLSHAAFLYVDDMFMFQDQQILPLSTACIAILCMLLQLPISWKKCELGEQLIWIGWRINIFSGIVSIPLPKRNRLLDLLRKLQSSSHGPKKVLEQFLGLALWVTQLWPHMRTWLHFLDRDLHSIPASQFSVDPGAWEEVCSCLSDDLRFHSVPRHTAIPLNGHLLQVRHKTITSKSDLWKCLLSDKRVWLRIRDPNSIKRKLSADSQRILQLFRIWMDILPPVVSLWPKQTWTGHCVADAFANQDLCGIGGAITFPSGKQCWYSLRLTANDFSLLKIPMHDNLQKDISSLETLAQIALVFIVIRHFPGFRIPLRMAALSDNTAAESVSNKLFSTQMPLALFLEKLSLLVSSSSIEVAVSHIAGISNDLADALSRWDGLGDPPHHCAPSDKFHLSLPELWEPYRAPQLCPPDAWLPWSLPS